MSILLAKTAILQTARQWEARGVWVLVGCVALLLASLPGGRLHESSDGALAAFWAAASLACLLWSLVVVLHDPFAPPGPLRASTMGFIPASGLHRAGAVCLVDALSALFLVLAALIGVKAGRLVSGGQGIDALPFRCTAAFLSVWIGLLWVRFLGQLLPGLLASLAAAILLVAGGPMRLWATGRIDQWGNWQALAQLGPPLSEIMKRDELGWGGLAVSIALVAAPTLLLSACWSGGVPPRPNRGTKTHNS